MDRSHHSSDSRVFLQTVLVTSVDYIYLRLDFTYLPRLDLYYKCSPTLCFDLDFPSSMTEKILI